jgi:hypothetical protein
LALGLARLSVAQSGRRIAAASGLLVLALIFAAIGLTAFTAALAIWLAHLTDPITAALIIGGAAFVLAAVLILIARTKTRKPSLFASPEAQNLMADLNAARSTAEVWAPLLGVAVLAYLLAAKSKDKS